jgi:cytochrome c553
MESRWRPPFVVVAAAIACLVAGAAQARSQAEWIELCASCHGPDGNSQLEKIPSLAGQPAFFVLSQLFLMREGVRQVEAMSSFVKELKDEDLNTLSKHYAGLPAKTTGELADPELARRGAAIAETRRCASCHLPSLAGQDQIPRLARQRIDYLIPTLKAYRDNPRPGADTAMSAAIVGASDADIAALAHYAASR